MLSPPLSASLSSVPPHPQPFTFSVRPSVTGSPRPLPSSSSVLSSFSDHPSSILPHSHLAPCVPPIYSPSNPQSPLYDQPPSQSPHRQSFLSSKAPPILSAFIFRSPSQPSFIYSPPHSQAPPRSTQPFLTLNSFSVLSLILSFLRPQPPHPLLSLLSLLIHPQPPFSPQILPHSWAPQAPLTPPGALPLSLPISKILARPPPCQAGSV